MYSVFSHTTRMSGTSNLAERHENWAKDVRFGKIRPSGCFSRTWFSCSHMVVKTLLCCTRKCGCKSGCMSASCFLQPSRNGSTGQVPVLEHESFSMTVLGTPRTCTRCGAQQLLALRHRVLIPRSACACAHTHQRLRYAYRGLEAAFEDIIARDWQAIKACASLFCPFQNVDCTSPHTHEHTHAHTHAYTHTPTSYSLLYARQEATTSTQKKLQKSACICARHPCIHSCARCMPTRIISDCTEVHHLNYLCTCVCIFLQTSSMLTRIRYM